METDWIPVFIKKIIRENGADLSRRKCAPDALTLCAWFRNAWHVKAWRLGFARPTLPRMENVFQRDAESLHAQSRRSQEKELHCRNPRASSEALVLLRNANSPRTAADPKLVAHFLDLHCLILDGGSQSPDGLSHLCNHRFLLQNLTALFFDSFMFFQELIEQHRVHRIITHAVDFAVLAAHHQVRIYFGHFLGDQPKLRDACCIGLIVKRHRLVAGADTIAKERERADSRIVAAGAIRLKRKLTHGRVVLAHRVAGQSKSSVRRVFAAFRVAEECLKARSRIIIPAVVEDQRVCSVRGVLGAGGVKQKRRSPSGRIRVSIVENQRSSAKSGVEAAGSIQKQRAPAKSGVSGAAGERIERLTSFRGREVWITPVRRRSDSLRSGQRAEAAKPRAQ